MKDMCVFNMATPCRNSSLSRHRYINSSWGWHPEDKLEELFHPDARFILVRRVLDEDLGEVVAFLSFRFDTEEGEEVAYL